MAARRTPRRRRRLLIAGVVALALIVLVGGLVLGRPQTGAASTALTATVKRSDVVVTVTASGSLVDQYTYSVPGSGTPTLTEIAGVATGSSGGATASSGSSSSGSSGSSSAGSSAGDAGYTTRSIAVTTGQSVKQDQALAVARDAAGKDHTVKAPVAGRIRTIVTAVGASASTVATIGAGRALIAVDVNENQIAEVKNGQTASVSFGTDGSTITGKVIEIAQVADDSSGVEEYRVLLTPDSLPAGSRIGMTATATIDITRHDDVLTVPAAAISEQHGHDTVQVVGARDSLRTVRVGVGLVGDAAVEITSGLTAGQQVVIGAVGTVPASTGPRAPGA